MEALPVIAMRYVDSCGNTYRPIGRMPLCELIVGSAFAYQDTTEVFCVVLPPVALARDQTDHANITIVALEPEASPCKCWNCGGIRPDTKNNCPHCGKHSIPF
jgi:hypothetical protein